MSCIGCRHYSELKEPRVQKHGDGYFEPHPAEAVMHAIDMAIEALRSSDATDINVGDITGESTQNVQDGDLISRKQAIGEISKQQTYKMFAGEDTVYLDASDAGSVLASLPSAQPVLTCDGCKYKGTYSTDMPCRGCLRREEDLYVPE